MLGSRCFFGAMAAALPAVFPLAPPADITTAIAMLDALDDDFKSILKEAAPELWDERYHLPHSPFRSLDMVEMYAGCSRLSRACEEAR